MFDPKTLRLGKFVNFYVLFLVPGSVFQINRFEIFYLVLCLFRAWKILKTEINVLSKWRLVARKRTDSHLFFISWEV